jgi:hypothetical protein
MSLTSNTAQINLLQVKPDSQLYMRKESQKQLNLNVHGIQSASRKSVETFIKDGYSKAFDANITISMPYLISLKKGNLKAALGLRSASSSLFIEQYLSQAIEQTLAPILGQVKRSQIVEIGNLFSNARVFTLPLLLTTAVSLHVVGFKYMVFTGTDNLIKLLNNTGVPVLPLADASLDALPGNKPQLKQQWGSYYDTNPKVALISLADVVRVINDKPKYAKLFTELTAQIAAVTSELVTL